MEEDGTESGLVHLTNPGGGCHNHLNKFGHCCSCSKLTPLSKLHSLFESAGVDLMYQGMEEGWSAEPDGGRRAQRIRYEIDGTFGDFWFRTTQHMHSATATLPLRSTKDTTLLGCVIYLEMSGIVISMILYTSSHKKTP